MRRARTWLAAAVLLAVLAAGAVVWAATSAGTPASAAASALPCARTPPSLSSAPVPGALAAALPVLARPHTSQDSPPHEAISMLSSLATGIELDHAQLVRTSAQGGRSWIVPVLHESPQIAPDVPCRRRQLSALKQLARSDSNNGITTSILDSQRAYIASAQHYLQIHSRPGQPGVIVFTDGQIVQGANGTLSAIHDGSAFATGECAGPGHDLLSVSGLAPAGTQSIELQAPDGATQVQPVGDGAYSFLFAPSPSRAGLPDRLVLLDKRQQPLRTLKIASSSFSTHPQCEIAAPPTSGGRSAPSQVLPAGYTVLAANDHGPGGVNYTIGVASGGAPDCDPYLAVQTSGSSTGGGTRYCALSFTASSVIPTFTSAGCGPQTVEMYGSVSSRVNRLRFIAPDGQATTTRVLAVPPSIASGYGEILAIGPTRVLSADPVIESLAANGRVLASSHTLRGFGGCGKSYPVTQLAPGTVTVAHAHTPQGPVAILLHRIRFLGHVSLCITQQPQGNEQCANYPLGPKSNQNIGNAPMWLMSGGRGSCRAPRFQVITGVMIHAGLSAWLRTSAGLSRLSTVTVPEVFGVPGPLFYAVLEGPATIVLRNARGRTFYTRPAASPTPSYSCGGLNPDTDN
jgi:hypothetical protein